MHGKDHGQELKQTLKFIVDKVLNKVQGQEEAQKNKQKDGHDEGHEKRFQQGQDHSPNHKHNHRYAFEWENIDETKAILDQDNSPNRNQKQGQNPTIDLCPSHLQSEYEALNPDVPAAQALLDSNASDHGVDHIPNHAFTDAYPIQHNPLSEHLELQNQKMRLYRKCKARGHHKMNSCIHSREALNHNGKKSFAPNCNSNWSGSQLNMHHN